MLHLKQILILSCLLFSSSILFAQKAVPDSVYRISTKDGNEYLGKIIYQDSIRLTIKTERTGDVNLFLVDIKKKEVIDKRLLKNDGYWNENPQATRYLWAPNGYGLKKGEGYYQNTWIFLNQAAIGITNNFSVGAGIIPLFLFAGEATPVWITPKFSIPVVKDKVNIGAGALVGTFIGKTDKSGFGLLYGMSTFGPKDKNVTVGLGWGYAANELSNTPTVNLSGLLRASRKWYLISENYHIDTGDDNLIILSMGARYLTSYVSLDFGFFMPLWSDHTNVVVLPWVGFSVPLKR